MIRASRFSRWTLGVAALWVASGLVPALAGVRLALEHEEAHAAPPHAAAPAHAHADHGRHHDHAPKPPAAEHGFELATHGHQHAEGTPAHDHPGVASRASVSVSPQRVAVAAGAAAPSPPLIRVTAPAEHHRRGPPEPLFLASHALLL